MGAQICVIPLAIFFAIWRLPTSMANEVIIANVAEDVLFVDRPLTLRCQSRGTGLVALSWRKDHLKMADVLDLGSGQVIVEPSFRNLTFEYEQNLFSIKFAALRVGDSGLYECVGVTEDGTEFSDSVYFEVYTKDRCVTTLDGDPHAKTEYLAEDFPPVLLIKCTYPLLPSQTLESAWTDGNSSFDEIITFLPASTPYATSVQTLYSADGNANGTVLTCLVGEETSNLTLSSAMFSCSLGPFYFYENPFVNIYPSDTPDDSTDIVGVIGGNGTISLSCRLVPSTLNGEITWNISRQFSNFTVDLRDSVSTIAVDIGGIESETFVLDASCSVKTNNGTYMEMRSFLIRRQPSDVITTDRQQMSDGNTTGIPNMADVDDRGENDQEKMSSLMLIVILLSVIVLILILVLLQIIIWCLIRRCDRRRKATNADGRPKPTGSAKSVTGLFDHTADANDAITGFTNQGFSEPPTYNDVFSISGSTDVTEATERRIAILDDEIEAEDNLEDISNLHTNPRFNRQSTVSTFSESPSYTPIGLGVSRLSTSSMPPGGSSYTPVERAGRQNSLPEEPYYDAAPSGVTSPLYAQCSKKKKKNTSVVSRNQREDSVSSERSSKEWDRSLDRESGISVSEHHQPEDIYFELTEGNTESTAC